MPNQKKLYFISFTEEGIFNPDYLNYIGGRIEIYVEEEQYAINEIRFLTKKLDEFHKIEIGT